jgi:hypothetical protein
MLENKKYHGRRRFIGPSNVFLSTVDWQSRMFAFKLFIKNSTQLQILDNLVYWHCNGDLELSRPFFSVLGTANIQDNNYAVQDFPPGPFWTKSINNLFVPALNGDFDTLKLQVLGAIGDIPGEFDKSFHLVMGDEKIELHFFLQKDYIG